MSWLGPLGADLHFHYEESTCLVGQPVHCINLPASTIFIDNVMFLLYGIYPKTCPTSQDEQLHGQKSTSLSSQDNLQQSGEGF